MRFFTALLLLPMTLMLASCADDIGANQYETSSVGHVSSAVEGTIVSVRRITVSTSEGAVGTIGGAVVGGALGSLIGGSDAVRVAGAAGGAVVGGAAGQAGQKQLSKQAGFEYVIRLDNGSLLTLTQGTDVAMAVGQRCIVLDAQRGDRARVIPAY